jgi:hypothetical protein
MPRHILSLVTCPRAPRLSVVQSRLVTYAISVSGRFIQTNLLPGRPALAEQKWKRELFAGSKAIALSAAHVSQVAHPSSGAGMTRPGRFMSLVLAGMSRDSVVSRDSLRPQSRVYSRW